MAHVKQTGSVKGFPARRKSPTRNCLRFPSTSSCPPPWRRHHQGQRRQGQLQDPRRGRQRPHHPRRRRHPAEEGRLRHPRRPVQRGRRHRQLLRMGAGPPVVLLDRGRGQRAPRPHHDQGVPPGARHLAQGERKGTVDDAAGRLHAAVQRVAEASGREEFTLRARPISPPGGDGAKF